MNIIPYLNKRKEYLISRIKLCEPESSMSKCAQARLYEINELIKFIANKINMEMDFLIDNYYKNHDMGDENEI